MKFIKSVPYIACGLLSMGLVAFSCASVVVLSDIAKERIIAAVAVNLTLSQLSLIDVRDL